jgi:O-antigen/teichoic acid export membrane protein
MAKSLKTNYIFSLINTITGMLFPLITFPYAARVLMPEGIGQVNFFLQIIQYIILLTCLGIPFYAIRETARVRDNAEELNRTTIEIITLHTALTMIGYVIVFVMCVTVAKIQADIPLFLLLSTNILFNAIGVEWFYQGTENFKYITVRGLIVRVVCLIFLFVFVRTKEDLMYYAAYNVFGVVGNNLFNFVHLRRYLSLKTLKHKDFKPLRHLAPALRIFVLNLIISIYVTLDSVMLGFLSDNAAVGYYTGATRITRLLISIISSLSVVMVSRMSNLVHHEAKDEFKALAQKSLEYVEIIIMPIAFAMPVVAPSLIRLFCGPDYEPAIMTIRILTPIIVAVGLANVFSVQVLYPQGKEKLIIIASATGAALNFTLNIFLIPRFHQDGAAFATAVAETTVTTTMFIIGRRFIPVKMLNKNLAQVLIASTVMLGACFAVYAMNLGDVVTLISMVLVGALIYFIVLGAQRNDRMMELVASVKQKITEKINH